MSFVDSLVKILPVLKKLDIKAFSGNKLSLNIGNKYIIKNDNRTLLVGKLTKKQQIELFSKLPQNLKEGSDVLEENFEKRAKNYQLAIGQSEQAETISFFQDKIPPEDVPILKASLYLKHLLDSGKPTDEIKKEIMFRHGQRGKSISNLCSAGYFETWFKPLYEEMSKSSGFTLDKFKEAYNEIIINQPFTVFVNIGMSEEEVKKIIQEKIGLMKKYDFENLHIHGIGESNVQRIRKAVIQIIKEDDFEVSTREEKSIIVVTLKKTQA